MKLQAHGITPIVSFGIFSQAKQDQKTIDPSQDEVIHSSTDDMFSVEIPAGTAPTDHRITVQLQVGQTYSCKTN